MCAQRRLRSAWASAQSDQSSLCAQRVAKAPRFLHADSKNSDQTGGRTPRLIWVFTGRTAILLVLSCRVSNGLTTQFCITFVFSYQHCWTIQTISWSRNFTMSLRRTKPRKWPVRPAKTDQPGHQTSLISLLSAWRKLGPSATHGVHSEDWSDWADAQADLSLDWAHMPFCWFCYAAAHFRMT